MSTISASTTSSTAYKVTADTTGTLVLQTGATPTTAMTLSTSQNATFAGTVADSTGTLRPLVSGTAVASTSGTSIDFTGIPSWAKKVTVLFSGVSTNGTSNLLIQIGSGSVTTSGYISSSTGASASVATVSSTSGFIIRFPIATYTASGVITISLITGSTYVQSNTLKLATTDTVFGGGDIALGGALDRVRITTVNGTDTFDGGSINLLWE
jgi:hypothetical protein